MYKNYNTHHKKEWQRVTASSTTIVWSKNVNLNNIVHVMYILCSVVPTTKAKKFSGNNAEHHNRE